MATVCERRNVEEELADLEWFLQEREAIRQHDLKRQEERLAELEE